MKIDGLREVWAAQDDRPGYEINERALRVVLQQRSQNLRRVLWSNEMANYWTGLWLGGFLLFLFWRGYPESGAMDAAWFIALVAATAALAYYLLFSVLIVGRRRLQSRPVDFSASLRERLDRELYYLDDQIASRIQWQRVLMHLVPPWLICLVIVWVMAIRDGEAFQTIDWLSLAVVTGGWVHMYLLQRRWVGRELMPRRRELAALRDKLDEPADAGGSVTRSQA